jgi:aminoglycoside phosphotransferase (APT) family kinase protein
MPERAAPGDRADAPGASGTLALVDVVDTWAQARLLDAPPLIVREGLRDVLHGETLPEVHRIDAGHSNPTFLVEHEDTRAILRRPPRPPFAPKAHDVLREHRILDALRDQPVRAPVPILACEDPAVIGAPFYLMEALDGIVLRDVTPAPLELVDALVELHAVPARDAGMGRATRGNTYLERQLALWSGQWSRLRHTREIPAIEEVERRLTATRPSSPHVAIVHGDYKLDNVFFARSAPARLIAILDWEMATLGDPLADVGYLTATWVDPGEPVDRLGGLSSVTAQPGFPSRRELAARYAAASGLPLDDLSWYQALALWKLAILLEASYQRHLAGTTSDEFFVTLEESVPRIAEQALGAVSGALA